MTTRHVKGMLVVSLLLPGLVGSMMAGAEEIRQTLDQVKVFSAEKVLDMTFNDPYRGAISYTEQLTTAGPLVACKLTADGGFYCLAGQVVIAWPNGPQSPQNYDLFDCTA